MIALLDRLLADLARRASVGGFEITIIKNNVNPANPDAATYGNHESYTCWAPMEQAADALIPHLVTRLPYAGSGSLSPSGFGFGLSQRARHIRQVKGTKTTHDRAIFCHRVCYSRDKSGGWTRAHLIGKDSARAPLNTYLTFGTTGLLFWILNHGGRIGKGLALAEPVSALRAVSADAALETPLQLASGKQMTALEIQRRYLADCQAFARRHSLPDWGEEVIDKWAEILDVLADNPLQAADRLDAYCKLWMYQRELHKAQMSWQDLQQGLSIMQRIRHHA